MSELPNDCRMFRLIGQAVDVNKTAKALRFKVKVVKPLSSGKEIVSYTTVKAFGAAAAVALTENAIVEVIGEARGEIKQKKDGDAFVDLMDEKGKPVYDVIAVVDESEPDLTIQILKPGDGKRAQRPQQQGGGNRGGQQGGGNYGNRQQGSGNRR